MERQTKGAQDKKSAWQNYVFVPVKLFVSLHNHFLNVLQNLLKLLTVVVRSPWAVTNTLDRHIEINIDRYR